MNSRKITTLIIPAFICLGIVYFFMFTPWGVHTIGETLFGGDKAKPYLAEDYPTEIHSTHPISLSIALPEEVKQPSGIDFDETRGAFFLVTDQAEIMELTENFQAVTSSVTISSKPLIFRQGSVESIDCFQDKMYIGGDLGVLEIWEKADNTWKKSAAIQPQGSQGINLEAEALAIHPENGNIYLGKDSTITIIDPKGNFVSEYALQGVPKRGRQLSDYIIAGMDFYEGVLYVLTEYHSAILQVNPSSGEIIAVEALEGITEGAGLAVTAESYFVVVDHELNEASPGVKVYKR